jgi:hypothetical protein
VKKNSNSLNNLKPFVKGEDARRNKNGRPRGSKNLATLIKELEDEDFAGWKDIPVERSKLMIRIGSPWRVIMYQAVAKAATGDVKAMEWLRRSGYGSSEPEVNAKGFFSQNTLTIEVVQSNHGYTEEPDIIDPNVISTLGQLLKETAE